MGENEVSCFFCQCFSPCCELAADRPEQDVKRLQWLSATIVVRDAWCVVGNEVRSIVKMLLAGSENDKSLAFDNLADHCPDLTKKQLHTMKDFDYADNKKKKEEEEEEDKKKELLLGLPPWPPGLPALGYYST